MTVKPYSREHALALLEPTGFQDQWTVDDQGLWPKAEFKQLHAWGLRYEYELFAWKPASVFADALDAPDLIKTPALPFPFDGSDLAALMLAGYGCLLADFYGDWASGPDEFQLSRIDPGNNFAKRAVKEAFDAYRKAVETVGGRDSELDRRASEACDAYSEARDAALVRHDTQAVAYPSPGDSDERRREMNAEYTRRLALVNAELVPLDEERERLQVESEAAEKKWLTAMVACLLQTKPQSAPVKPGKYIRWTPEFTSEVRAYRANHTEEQTAEKYGISGSRIRRKLADKSGASKPKTTPFSVLMHRIR